MFTGFWKHGCPCPGDAILGLCVWLQQQCHCCLAEVDVFAGPLQTSRSGSGRTSELRYDFQVKTIVFVMGVVLVSLVSF